MAVVNYAQIVNKYQPKISIITPSFNQAKYLEQTILSVINQNYPDLEYIIIDGGSTDASLEIIKKYQKYLSYWISEKDNGQSDAINKGIKVASGDIINWLNSDDYYEPGALLKVADYFKDPAINIVSGRGRLFRGEVTAGYTKGVDLYEGNLAKTIGWVRMDQPETFYRAQTIEKLGLLNSNLHYLMDRDWWLKYLLIHGLKGTLKTQDIFVNFRLHEESKTFLQKEEFETEHNSIFFSLAKQNGFDELAAVINSAGKIRKELMIDTLRGINKELLKKAFSYYFLLRGNMNYAMNKKQNAAMFYSYVNEADLEMKDKRLLKNMKLRNKLPVSIINLLRKFTR